MIAAFLFFFIRRKLEFPYRTQSRLLTKAESVFFKHLVNTLEPQYRVHCAVRVADILAVKKGFSFDRRALYRITSKHCDYVISSPDASTIYAAIELDDKSHERPDRRRRDIFLDKAFKSAGLPLHRYPVSNRYNLQGLISELNRNQSAVSMLAK